MTDMNSDLDIQMRVIERLVDLFRRERLTYLYMAGGAVVILLVAVGIMLAGPGGFPAVILLIAAAGVLSYAIGGVLSVWDRARKLAQEELERRAGRS